MSRSLGLATAFLAAAPEGVAAPYDLNKAVIWLCHEPGSSHPVAFADVHWQSAIASSDNLRLLADQKEPLVCDMPWGKLALSFGYHGEDDWGDAGCHDAHGQTNGLSVSVNGKVVKTFPAPGPASCDLGESFTGTFTADYENIEICSETLSGRACQVTDPRSSHPTWRIVN